MLVVIPSAYSVSPAAIRLRLVLIEMVRNKSAAAALAALHATDLADSLASPTRF